MREYEDEILIKKIRAGDKEAETQLCHKYLNLVFNVFFKILKNEQDAEDGCQELFIYLLRRGGLCKWRSEGQFKSWLYRVSLNKAIDFYRLRKRAQEEGLIKFQKINTPISSPPDDEVIKKQRLDKIDEILNNSVNIKCREAFELRVMCELSYKDIADLLGEEVTTITNWIYRVKQLLITNLKEF